MWKAFWTVFVNFLTQVMRSIKDNITEDVLLNEINQIIRLPLYADRIQRDIKAHQHMISLRRKWVILKAKHVEQRRIFLLLLLKSKQRLLNEVPTKKLYIFFFSRRLYLCYGTVSLMHHIGKKHRLILFG